MKTLLPLVVLWSGLAASASVDLRQLSNEELVSYAARLEQVSMASTLFDSLAPELDRATKEAADELALRFEARTGIGSTHYGQEVDKMAQQAAWQNVFMTEADPLKRCEIFKLAYGVAITRLAVMKASIPDAPQRLIDVQDEKSAFYAMDLERARWELRWVTKTAFLKAMLRQVSCMDPLNPRLSLVDEVALRWQFISEGLSYTTPSGKTLLVKRWPVGRARAMCGRPFNAHYFDHLLEVDPERPLDAYAKGVWGKISSREDFAERLTRLFEEVQAE